MARDLTSALNDEFTAGSFRLVFFFKSVWNSGTSYIWTGYDDIVWDSNTWTGVGHFGGMSSIEETKEIRATGASFVLSGVPSDLISLVLGDARQGNEVSLWVGALDTDNSLIADPYQIFSGLMDVPSIQEGGETSIISVQAENRLIELDRPRELRNTDKYQQARFSGDLGMQYVAALQDKQINWGQSG